jgi:hypothetical protein
MKRFGVLLGAALLMVLVNGCVAPVGYGGSYGAVYGEYPTTYYGGYYSDPGYSYYYPRYTYRRWGPYDRDHYWDREHHWDRHGYGHRDWDDWHR